ncbi:QRFP-like peptide receptor [Mercenaria mercenaria]|uniref:QRFP-like peptide receptor n=1 Tax=Mercenaria mercenaria TaxID=6596 RepID=UPI00234F2C60|nr:QRFP-like peptide receptor [Mercenaria mercenaria]
MSGDVCERNTQHYDFDSIPYPGTLQVFPGWEIGVKVTLGVIVELVALVGNCLVITIVIRFKSMRTTTNYYLVNLAISDLLVAIMPIWIHVVSSLNEFWVFGSFLCKFNPFMQITAMCASMFTLLVIAGDRFFAIMYPMKSRVTRRKVSIMLSLVWFLAMAIGSPLLFVYHYDERKWLDVKEAFCAGIWPTKVNSDGSCDNGITSKKIYWIIVCGVLNWTPMLFMTLAYTFIVIRLRKHKIVPKLGASSKSSIQERSKRRVVIMLFSVLIAFIVCAVPFQTIRIYFLFTREDIGYKLPDWYPTLDFGAVLLMYSNAAINPVIYAGLNENFRKGFKDLINGVINRNSPNASAEFESEYKQRSTMRARGSRAALVGGSESVATAFEANACESEVETDFHGVENEHKNNITVIANGITNVNYFLFGEGNKFDENKPEIDTVDTEDKKDTDSGLGDGFIMEPTECMSKF